MAQFNHLYSVHSGQGRFTGDAHLAEDDLRMLTGDGIIINDQDTHLMRTGHALCFSALSSCSLLGVGRQYAGRVRIG